MGNQKYDAFLKVAETGSFKQAAHDLGYTQAGISYLVSTLERELDVPLFVRDYGGAHLTSDGADLLPWVQNVCNSERQLEMRLAELKHLESGIVRVAAFTSTAIQWFPGIAKRFLAQHPGIDLQLICVDDEDALEEAVWRGDADCGFFVYPIKHDLHAVPLRKDPLLVVLPPDHPLADAPFVPREALAEELYIRLESGTSSEMETLFRANDVEPNVRFTIDSGDEHGQRGTRIQRAGRPHPARCAVSPGRQAARSGNKPRDSHSAALAGNSFNGYARVLGRNASLDSRDIRGVKGLPT